MTNPAETYESYMVPSLFGPWADKLIEIAEPGPGKRVLDVGCCTGIVARHIAPCVQPGGTVTGVDATPGMLEVARAASSREGFDIEWHEASAEALPFPDGSFDLVTSQSAAMFFSDHETALKEMRRVLADDGRLAISVWQGIEQHPFYKQLDDVVYRRFGMSSVGEIFALGDAGQVRGLIEGAGFRDTQLHSPTMENRFPDPGAFLAGEIDLDTAAIPSMQHLGEDERKRVVESISEEMRDALAAVTQGDEVVLPFHAYIFTAER